MGQHTPRSFQKSRFWLTRLSQSLKSSRKSGSKGFTLIELIVTSLLVSVVILVSWSGLISLTHMSSVAEAKSMRLLEVNRAIDFVTEEIRKSRAVNSDGITIVDGTTTDIADLLTTKGFDLSVLGNYGDLALYLEVPAIEPPQAICPAGGPNAGNPPPTPSEFDQVIYDVRPSPDEWLAPRTVMRYGRIHSNESTFNPCDSPISSDPIADALSDDQTKAPSCAGVITGGPGFYTCGENNQTKVTFLSSVVDSSTEELSTTVASRVQPIAQAPIQNVDCSNEASLRSLNNDTPTKITFYNHSGNSIWIYRINQFGLREFYGGWVLPGASLTYDTYVTHPWIATDILIHSCLAVFMPEESHTFATVN